VAVGDAVRPGAGAAAERSPARFVALTFALAAPPWALGALTDRGLLRELGTTLPFSAVAVVCPIAAALILVRRHEGSAGTRRFLRRVFDPRSIRPVVWYLPIVGLLPLLYALSYGVMRVSGVALPAPQASVTTVVALLAVFLVAAACEEAGWTGYATDPLQARFGALGAALALGLVWAAFHLVPTDYIRNMQSDGRFVRSCDIVGSAEIAARFGFARPQSLSLLRQRRADFPPPIAKVGAAFVWSWPDVEAWAIATGRLKAP
jgi:membrane protease YdiL (CAAX protease family)